VHNIVKEVTVCTNWFGFKPVVPKVCSADTKGSATRSLGIRSYISAMVILNFASL